MRLQNWIDRAFWGLLTGVAIYMAGQLTKVSDSVNDLNTKMSVYITKSDSQGAQLADHEGRIRTLEADDRVR